MPAEHELAQILTEIEKAVRTITLPLRLGSDAPEILYHYTTIEGALGILESRHIWCSAVRCTNDPSEGIHARELILSRLRLRLPRIVASMEQTFGSIERYTSSFSANGDLLQQWRAYCRNGRGVAVGIPTALFQSNNMVTVGRVCYDLKLQQDIVDRIIEAYESAPVGGRAQPPPELVSSLANNLYMLAIYFKTPAYFVEQEYRVHYMPLNSPASGARPSDLRFRAGPIFPIPYVSVPLSVPVNTQKAAPVAQLIVGPCLEWEPTEMAFRLLLEREQLPNVKIIRSEVQMRHY